MSIPRPILLDGVQSLPAVSVDALRSKLGSQGAAADETALRVACLTATKILEGTDGLGRPLHRQTYRETFTVSRVFPYGLAAVHPVEQVVALRRNGEALDLAELALIEIKGLRRHKLSFLEIFDGCLEVDYIAGWLMPDQIQDWAPDLAVTEGQWVRPSTPSLLRFQVEVSGTTGTDEPAWPADGQAVTDNDISWRAAPAMELPEDLQWVALVLAAEIFRGGLEIPAGIESESDLAGSVRYRKDGAALPPIVERVAQGYR